MEQPNILLIATTIEYSTVLDSIVYTLLFLYFVWMAYYCVIKDTSEYIQRKVSSWVRAYLGIKKVPRVEKVPRVVKVLSTEDLSDIEEADLTTLTVEEKESVLEPAVIDVKHDVREYTRSSGHRVIEHTFNDSYVILEIYDIFTKKECTAMRKAAEKEGLETSQVMSYKDDDNAELDQDIRKSSHIFLDDSTAPVFTKFAEIAAEFTGVPVTHQEETQIVSYKAGGMYTEHYDGCVDTKGKEFCINSYGSAGDRLATLLVYINDNYTGGQTRFTKLGFSVTPELGKGILFYNIDKDERIIVESEHTGTKVINGNKWIATKWVHIRPFT
jgi:prolyl 4-hydroxylase